MKTLLQINIITKQQSRYQLLKDDIEKTIRLEGHQIAANDTSEGKFVTCRRMLDAQGTRRARQFTKHGASRALRKLISRSFDNLDENLS